MELSVFPEKWEPKVTSNHDTYEVSYGPPCNEYHCCLQHYLSKPEQPMLPHDQGVAYVRSHKVEAASAGGSEANRGRREVATFATARFN